MDIQEIQNQLAELPQKIRDSLNDYADAKHNTEIAKLRYEVSLSQNMLKSKRANATLQKAESIILSKEEKKALFKSELEESKLKNEADFLSNRFVAIRKLANLYELESKGINSQGF